SRSARRPAASDPRDRRIPARSHDRNHDRSRARRARRGPRRRPPRRSRRGRPARRASAARTRTRIASGSVVVPPRELLLAALIEAVLQGEQRAREAVDEASGLVQHLAAAVLQLGPDLVSSALDAVLGLEARE